MGQFEVEKYLQEQQTYVTARQVCEAVNKTMPSTNRILENMVRWGEADKEERKMEVGNTNRKVRVYKFVEH